MPATTRLAGFTLSTLSAVAACGSPVASTAPPRPLVGVPIPSPSAPSRQEPSLRAQTSAAMSSVAPPDPEPTWSAAIVWVHRKPAQDRVVFEDDFGSVWIEPGPNGTVARATRAEPVVATTGALRVATDQHWHRDSLRMRRRQPEDVARGEATRAAPGSGSPRRGRGALQGAHVFTTQCLGGAQTFEVADEQAAVPSFPNAPLAVGKTPRDGFSATSVEHEAGGVSPLPEQTDLGPWLLNNSRRPFLRLVSASARDLPHGVSHRAGPRQRSSVPDGRGPTFTSPISPRQADDLARRATGCPSRPIGRRTGGGAPRRARPRSSLRPWE